MSNEVLIALISSISALGGSIVGIFGNFIISSISERKRLKKENRDLMLDLYSEFISALQNMMNVSNVENFDKLTDLINKIKLVGGKEVVSIVSQYYFELCDKEKGLDAQEHKYYQNGIINEMRKELNNKEVIGHISLIANKAKDE